MSEDEVAYVVRLLESFGSALELKESLLDVSATVGGSSRLRVICSLRPWQILGVAEDCLAHRLTRSPLRLFWVLQKWFSKVKTPQELEHQVTFRLHN